MDMFKDRDLCRVIMSVISTGAYRSLWIIVLIATFKLDAGIKHFLAREKRYEKLIMWK